MKQVFEKDFRGRKLVVEIGELAKQANAAALVRYEDTVVFTATCASKEATTMDFFPLMVMYNEKMYAAGKIPGGFQKREGRPSDNATLTARVIDRPLRPLFADGFRNEVQVINNVMSVDFENAPEMVALFGSSLTLVISDVPFNGPVAGVVVGRVDGKLIINPTPSQLEVSDIDLTVAGTYDAINMVEAGAKQVSEKEMLEAILFGHEAIKELCEFQKEIQKAVGKEKMEIQLYEVSAEVTKNVESLAKAKLVKAVSIKEKVARYTAIDDIKKETLTAVEEANKDSETLSDILKQSKQALDKIVKDEVRRAITEDKIRPDGRGLDEIRPLDSQIDILPRTHGSALFTRGQTQALSVTTLGAANEYKILDELQEGEEHKRFMLHYNFPQFSVGETGRYGAPGRREIGHGALGERALAQVIPSVEEFPYTIRVVSEILESNGSTSQASICAGCMSLMAAGVPLKAPVAGIAMGLVTDGKNYSVLSDIQGMEDHLGDMDFKVAGTKDGITALQMDIKIEGLTPQILEEALTQANKGRNHILQNMIECIDTPRTDVSAYAPKLETFMIDPDKIKEVIGKGGEMITKIIQDCNDVKIDIDDNGQVIIYHKDRASINKAKETILGICKVAKVGEVYNAKVVRLEKFGCFMHLFGKTQGLLHISKLANERVEKVEDVVKIGDIIEVKIVKIDEKGRLDLVRNDLPEVKRAPRADKPAKEKTTKK